MKKDPKLQNKAIQEARALAIDMVEKANSGHPGMPLGATPALFELYANHMNFNPKDPKWPNRDRFVLSAGHASAMIYALNYLFGFGYTMEDLKEFRSFASETPGHPDYDLSKGIEMTTGPLGQGLATAVGMALAERHLAAMFNTEDTKLFDHYTYVMTGDGCLMEGITSEASSLAGHLGLDKLIVLYDSNHTTIDGNTSLAFTEDTRKRYEAYGWHTQVVEDANDTEKIGEAIENAKNYKGKPSFIEIKSIIGYGSPEADSSAVHGSPLGEDGVYKTKEALGLDPENKFYVSDDVLEYTRSLKQDAQVENQKWQDMLEAYLAKDDEKAEALRKYMNDEWADLYEIDGIDDFEGAIATRNTSHTVLNKISAHDPLLVGGSADLAGSNKTNLDDSTFMSKDDYSGKNIHYGVREFGMGAIANGLTLSGLHSFCATFLVFTDYMRYDIREAALMEIPTVFVMTHDSIGLGEDGQTHQPIEHLSSLRAIPNLWVWRPADGKEVAAAYASAKRNGPTLLSLSRQDLETLDETSMQKASKGAYILAESNVKDNEPELILMASGSEVEVTKEAYEELAEQGVSVRLVSVPSMEAFEAQDEDYKESVLPKATRKRISVEAGADMSWYKYIGTDGKAIAINEFGDSAPGEVMMEKYGFTKENILANAKELLED